MKKILLILVLSVFVCTAFSDDVINTAVQNTVTRNTEIAREQAKEWGLTENEWKQYMQLMQGPSGHYYEKLTPAEVLGINADNMEDMRKYAEISAKQEHDKLERELKFNAAFHEAAAKLYAEEPLIRPFDLTPYTPIPKD